MVRSGSALLALLIVAAAAGCARRASAYHFRAPLVGSVNASAWLSQPDPAPGSVSDEEARGRYRDVGRDHRRGGAIHEPAARRPVRLAIASEPLRGSHSGDQQAAALRQLVGSRDEDSSHVQFALAALDELGAGLDPRLRAADDGPALRDLAGERGALIDAEAQPGSPPRVGDLLLFDRVDGDQPASLVAVVVSTDSRGVVEFVYLGRGVVRRGHLSRAHPADKRAGDGRVLNTFIRHSDGGDPTDTRYLAGELYAGTVRLARLLR